MARADRREKDFFSRCISAVAKPIIVKMIHDSRQSSHRAVVHDAHVLQFGEILSRDTPLLSEDDKEEECSLFCVIKTDCCRR